MKIDLSSIRPETPTEAALLCYAREIEHKLRSSLDAKGYYPEIGFRDVGIEKVSGYEMERYWRGMVRISHERNAYGEALYLRTGDIPGEDKRFECSIVVSHEELLENKVLTANKMGELLKQGLNHIAKIHDLNLLR